MTFLENFYRIVSQTDLTDNEKGLLKQASDDIIMNKRISFSLLGENKDEIFKKLESSSMYEPYKKLLEETLERTLREPDEDIKDETIVF